MHILVTLILLFCLLPIAELALLFYCGSLIGGWQTFGIIIVTGVIGAILAKHQGRQAWREVRQALAKGQLPAKEMVNALLILIAGVVLLTPGLITDCIGFFLLLPPGRAVIRGWLAAKFARGLTKGSIKTYSSGASFSAGSGNSSHSGAQNRTPE